jgi:uncharacterized protein
MNVEEITAGYGRFIGKNPLKVLAAVIIISALMQYGNSILEQSIQDNSDMLPDTYPEISAIEIIQNEFGGMDSGVIVIELDAPQEHSTQPRDIRDAKIIKYADILSRKAAQTRYVVKAASIADTVVQDGRIPEDKATLDNLIKANPLSPGYVSGDYSMTLVKLNFIPNAPENELYDALMMIIESTPKPPGVKVDVSGDFAISTSMNRDLGPDMAKTSQTSMAGILIVIIILFGSLRYGLTSLSVIVFGVMWAFGIMGLLGYHVTNVTSGGASMIMGIGIDFGIQVTSRFRIELKKKRIEEAMAETLRAVSTPMGTTTIAALIGFQAMSMGELTVLSDLGRMMSIGTLACMMAALTVVPIALVLGEKTFGKKVKKR